MRIWYPRVGDLMEINKEALEQLPAKKKERYNRLDVNTQKLRKVIQGARAKKGDVEDKSLTLMRRINQDHPFGSGNRRTAHLAMNRMLYCNKGYMVAMKVDRFDKVQKQIRDRCLKHKEIRREYKI